MGLLAWKPAWIKPPPPVQATEKYGPYAYCSLDKTVACMFHTPMPAHTRGRQKGRVIMMPKLPPNEAVWVQVGKDCQHRCPWSDATCKFITNPVCYAAALDSVLNQTRYQVNATPPVAGTNCSLAIE